MFGNYFYVFLLCGLMSVQGRSFPEYTYHPEINGWLKLHREAVDWQDARITCHMEGALLAADWNANMRSTINKLQAFEDESFSVMHVGAEVTLETNQNGTYVYLEGEPTLLNLPGGRFMRPEPCIGFLVNGTVGEVDCNEKLPHVCYVPTPACGSDSLGYKFFKGTEHCYKYSVGPLNWTEAYQACKREGAYLAVINSNEEAQYLAQLKDQTDCCTSIGFYYWTFSNSWLTVTENYKDGYLTMFSFTFEFTRVIPTNDRTMNDRCSGQTLEQAGYEKWDNNEPTSKSNPDTVYRFGFMNKYGLLFSQTSSNGNSYICEKNSMTLSNAN